jgi:hypothetical protein
MTWLAWRQFRPQAIASAILLAAVVAILAITGVHLEHLYTTYKHDIHTCNALSCDGVQSKVTDTYHHVRLLGSLLIGLPAILGLFWGAPLVARELEHGTHRLAWTQSVTRTRWLLIKLLVVGLASAVTAGLFSLAVTWWAMPYDQIDANHLSPPIFDQRGIVPIGYALFGFVLGVLMGMAIKRTLPAMVATLVGFITTRMLTQYLLRPHLFAPLHKVLAITPSLGVGLQQQSDGQVNLDFAHPNLHGGWVTGQSLIDAQGHSPTTAFIQDACGKAMRARPGPPGAVRVHAGRAAQDAFTSCIQNVGAKYHVLVSYQPNARFWEFQWAETGIFLGFAVLLGIVCVGLVRRRLA